MSTFQSPKAAAAALVFLILYTVYVLAAGKIVYKEGFKTVYTFLLVYGLIRFGGQLCGVVFAALGLEHWQWLIAYLVLGAEGYFALVLTGFRFIVKGQRDKFGTSWLEPTKQEKNAVFKNPSSTPFQLLGAKYPIKWFFHSILVGANVIIIYGGTSTAGKSVEELSADPLTLSTAKICRTVGQALFLASTLFVIGLAYYTYLVEKVNQSYPVKAAMVAAPFLTVRGIFGILSVYIPSMDYYSTANYTATGLNARFVTFEYVLGTTMEFITGALFIGSYYFQHYENKPNINQQPKFSDEESQSSTN